jgi:hypothetical protein
MEGRHPCLPRLTNALPVEGIAAGDKLEVVPQDLSRTGEWLEA